MTEVVSIPSRSLGPDTPESQDLAVYCRGVVKRFGAGGAQVTALRGIDLDVRTGELMMLVGPSGCGKTTLISVVAGILNQDEGVCRVFGREFSRMNGQEK